MVTHLLDDRGRVLTEIGPEPQRHDTEVAVHVVAVGTIPGASHVLEAWVPELLHGVPSLVVHLGPHLGHDRIIGEVLAPKN